MIFESPLFSFKRLIAACAFLACATTAQEATGQPNRLPLQDLSSFQDPGKTWQIAEDVAADLNKANKLNTTQGTGVLVNLPKRSGAGKDLFTNFEHGDVDVELDYMMAKGSNSGIYLQGRYEVQLEDSWGKTTLSAANNGGVYERWDESRPKGQHGFQGYAPRQNVSRAPGLCGSTLKSPSSHRASMPAAKR
jgi:hypothetical protein